MARTKATPEAVNDQITDAVTQQGNAEAEAPMPASTLAEIEAGKAALAKIAASNAAE